MNFGKINIADVVCGVIIANLTTRPVEAFDLNDFAVLDGAGEGDLVCILAGERSYLLGWEVYCQGASGSRDNQTSNTCSWLDATHMEHLLVWWRYVKGHLCGIADFLFTHNGATTLNCG